MQDAIASITIAEKVIGLYFGYPCFQIYSEACAENADYMALEAGSGAAVLLEAAHRNHCLIERSKPVITFKELYEWVEKKIIDGETSAIADLINQWGECSITKDAVAKIQKKTEEMKAASQQS